MTDQGIVVRAHWRKWKAIRPFLSIMLIVVVVSFGCRTPPKVQNVPAPADPVIAEVLGEKIRLSQRLPIGRWDARIS